MPSSLPPLDELPLWLPQPPPPQSSSRVFTESGSSGGPDSCPSAWERRTGPGPATNRVAGTDDGTSMADTLVDLGLNAGWPVGFCSSTSSTICAAESSPRAAECGSNGIGCCSESPERSPDTLGTREGFNAARLGAAAGAALGLATGALCCSP
jgi:hypothetical protein